MAEKKKNVNKRYLYIFIGVIIVFSIILFLFLGISRKSSNFVGIQAYKYQIGKDEYKYYVEKITSSKVSRKVLKNFLKFLCTFYISYILYI